MFFHYKATGNCYPPFFISGSINYKILSGKSCLIRGGKVNYGVGALVSVSNQEGVFEKVASAGI